MLADYMLASCTNTKVHSHIGIYLYASWGRGEFSTMLRPKIMFMFTINILAMLFVENFA